MGLWWLTVVIAARRAPKGVALSALKQVLNYSVSQYIEIDGFKIHYFQEGRGPDLLLVHGLGASLVCWAPVFSELKKHFRVTALDLPGFGRSSHRTDVGYGLDDQAQRLHQFMAAVGVNTPFVVAHSMGGAIAGLLAKQNPAAVKKILFLAPALNRWLVLIHPELLTWFVRSTKKFIVNPAFVRWLYLKRVTYRPPNNAETLIEAYHQPFAQSSNAIETFWRHTHLLRDHRLPKGLAHLQTPAKILIGSHDLVVPRRYLVKFLELNPQIQISEVKNCGHQIMEEDPQALIREIQHYFQT